VICDAIVDGKEHRHMQRHLTSIGRSIEITSKTLWLQPGLVNGCFVDDFDWSRLPELNRRPSNYESQTACFAQFQ